MAEGMKVELVGEGFFDPMARQGSIELPCRRESIIVSFLAFSLGNILIIIVLEVLATLENYRNLGLASKLLKRGGEMRIRRGWRLILMLRSWLSRFMRGLGM